jgi:hypothetical protein
LTTTKQCWSCSSTVPYEGGFCPSCIVLIPSNLQALAHDYSIPEPLGGSIRTAFVSYIRHLRRPVVQYTPRPKSTAGKKITGIKLGDLKL